MLSTRQPGALAQDVLCLKAQYGLRPDEYGSKDVAQMGYTRPLPSTITALLYLGGKVLDAPTEVETDMATLGWLVDALEQARSQGHSKTAGYLEAVAEDVVFETEMATRPGVNAPRDPG